MARNELPGYSRPPGPSDFHAFRNGMSIARRHATLSSVRSFGAFHGFNRPLPGYSHRRCKGRRTDPKVSAKSVPWLQG